MSCRVFPQKQSDMMSSTFFPLRCLVLKGYFAQNCNFEPLVAFCFQHSHSGVDRGKQVHPVLIQLERGQVVKYCTTVGCFWPKYRLEPPRRVLFTCWLW